MDDPKALILAAFHRKPSLCIHVLGEMTSMPRDVLLKLLSELVREGQLIRLNEGVKGEYVYCSTSEDTPVLDVDKNALPMLMGMSELEVVSRVAMLKTMKSRLIRDWHPVLDKVIGDYERGLKIVESLRCVDDDEPSFTQHFGRN